MVVAEGQSFQESWRKLEKGFLEIPKDPYGFLGIPRDS